MRLLSAGLDRPPAHQAEARLLQIGAKTASASFYYLFLFEVKRLKRWRWSLVVKLLSAAESALRTGSVVSMFCLFVFLLNF